MHLVEACEDHMEWFAEPFRGVAEARIAQLRRWLKVRMAVAVLLWPAVLVALLAALARILPILGDAVDVLVTVVGYASALSFLVAGIYLMLTRFIGQLEADLISCLAVGATQRAHQDPAPAG